VLKARAYRMHATRAEELQNVWLRLVGISRVYTMQVCSRESSAGDARRRFKQVQWIMEVATRARVQSVELSVTCTKRLLAHPRHLTRASQLASCKRGFRCSWVNTAHAECRDHDHTSRISPAVSIVKRHKPQQSGPDLDLLGP
jgi:hypothetical protein